MSGTLDVILEPRLGPRASGKRQRKWIGSDTGIWIDVRSVLTGKLVPNATGAAAWYRFYAASGDDAPDQPLEVTEPTPGTLHVRVPCDLPGTCDVGFQIAEPSRAAAHITFDVASNGGLTVTASGVIPYGDLQSVAVAAALSAVRPEVRRVAAQESAAAVGEAISEALGDIAGAAAEAVADQLAEKASTARVEEVSRQVEGKAEQADVDDLTQAVSGKADAETVAALETRLGTKANATTVQQISTKVNLKADATDVQALDGRVAALERLPPVLPPADPTIPPAGYTPWVLADGSAVADPAGNPIYLKA